MAGSSELDLGFLDDAKATRDRARQRRTRVALGVSATVTVVWAVAVSLTGHWDRVADNWISSVTMIFGSFVAGSTPQGGGAVAFPVFTKGLEVPAEVARSFSLCIQTIGMGTASVAILVTRRRIEWTMVAVGIPTATVGFVAGLFLVGEPDERFWPSTLPGAYVKVGFTLLVAAMALIVFLGTRVPLREVRTSVATDPAYRRRHLVAIGLAGLAGGFTSSAVGSGADVFLYLAVVVVLGLEPRVAVPSSVLVMAFLSVLGLVVLGLADGQLDVVVAGDEVVAVAGDRLAEPVPAERFDLFGLWLAAVPVVGWGAPLGSAFAAKLTTRSLAVFVAALAAAEVVTTLIFLDELRENAALAAFGIVGGLVLVGGLLALSRLRHRLVGVRHDPEASLSRGDVDVAPDYRRSL